MSFRDQTVEALLASLAAKTPAPGGGTAAALTAALSAATGLMVVSWSAGRKSLASCAPLHEEARHALEALRIEALDLADADAEAYGRLSALLRLDPGDAARRRALPGAVRDAIDAPARVLGACVAMLDLYERLCGATSPALASDLAIAAILAKAGARSAAWNVRANLTHVEDAAEAGRIERETNEALERLAAMRARIEAACRATQER